MPAILAVCISPLISQITAIFAEKMNNLIFGMFFDIHYRYCFNFSKFVASLFIE